MALKQNYSMDFFGKNVVFENCYFKVAEVFATKNSAKAMVHAMTKSDGDIIDRKQYTFSPDLNGPNFIKQSYEYLKTLPEFAGATDC
jgi:hypothetical protein